MDAGRFGEIFGTPRAGHGAARSISGSNTTYFSHTAIFAIVDDDASVLKAIPRLLKICGFRTETFDSGQSFLDALRECNPDCVLLDLHMLSITGWEVMAEMAALGYSIPVILITGDGDPALLEKAMATGAAALLRKPFSEQQLLETITAAME